MPRDYNISVSDYNASQWVNVIKGCNGFTVVNLGDTIVQINGITLFPADDPTTDQGDSLSVGGNEGEIYKGNMKLSFMDPVGSSPKVTIIQKFYVDSK